METCEAEICHARRDGYTSCDQPATRISRFGWVNCEEHSSPSDLLLTHKCAELAHRKKMRELCVPSPNEDLSTQSEALSTEPQNLSSDKSPSDSLAQNCN